MLNSNNKITLYDTTLRDGTQAEEVNFTVQDKIRIAHKLADFGIDFIEGGWPGSNPRDGEFFKEIKKHPSIFDRMAAFGSTRRIDKTCEHDSSIQALIKTGVPTLTIFGKSWDLHVIKALKISLDENLEIIFDTIKYT